jgi:PHD/YefM family antitoxin component YafN of YafNO toxin-antitoxin module
MNVTTMKLNGKEYVVIPKRRYEQLTRAERDKKDTALVRKVMGDIRAGRTRTIPLEEARKAWGV